MKYIRQIKPTSKLILAVFLLISLTVSLLSPLIILNQTKEKVNAQNISVLEEGVAYRIRNQNSGYYLAMLANISVNGARFMQLPFISSHDQEFMLKKISVDIYELIPLHAPTKRAEVKDSSDKNGAYIQINSSNNSIAQRFKIVNDGNGTNSFIILTQTSNFNKCVTVENASMSSMAYIIQLAFTSFGANSHYYWYFEKVESLSINAEKVITQNSLGSLQLLFGEVYPVQDVTYLVEFTGAANMLVSLTIGDITTIYPRTLTNKLTIEINNTNIFTYYSVSASYYAAWGADIRIRLRPKYQMWANSYLGNGYVWSNGYVDNVDTTPATLDMVGQMNRMNYYVNHYVNQSITQNDLLFNNPIINNKYYQFSGHGNESGASVIHAPEQVTWSSNLPTMYNTEIAIWAACYTARAYNKNGVYLPSVQEQSIINGALYSIGWENAIGDYTSASFCEFFWEYIADGGNARDAASYAGTSTGWKYWYCPWIWILDSTLQWSLLENPNTASQNSVSINSVSSMQLLKEHSYLNNSSNYFRKENQITGEIKYSRLINGIISNDVTTVIPAKNSKGYEIFLNTSSEANHTKPAQFQAKNKDQLKNFFYIWGNNQWNLVEIIVLSPSTTCSYVQYTCFNHTTQKEVPFSFVENAFY